jgi:hypothetical protein
MLDRICGKHKKSKRISINATRGMYDYGTQKNTNPGSEELFILKP